MSHDDGHRGNGDDHHLPYNLIGASAEEAYRDAVDVVRRLESLERSVSTRLDWHTESLAALHRELAAVRADHGRIADALTALSPLAEHLRKLAEALGVEV